MLKKVNLLRLTMLCVIALMIFSVSTVGTSAYVKNGFKLSVASATKIYIGQSLIDEGNKTRILNHANVWDYSGSPLSFTYVRPYNSSIEGQANTIVFAKSTSSNGTYAINYHYSNKPISFSRVTLYKAFYGATSAQKNEVLAHEVGHSVGLSHCQSSKNTISVMRATGFNNKVNPLSDDKSGVSSIY